MREVRKETFSMKALKAPGPDGVQPLFYQHFWNTIAMSLFQFCQKCFHENLFLADLNNSYITLIPKTKNPENISQFRPITLCNVSYKILAEIIVDRLRPILCRTISPQQASFLPGRQASDNIFVTQEIIHTLMNLKGKSGGLILKIDLEKAYDMADWDFLESVLKWFNVEKSFCNLIMSCVKNTTTSILWNGTPLTSFNPSRGLRQGDPLSPYLFVMCMEYLSALILDKVNQNKWKGIKASPNRPTITHLFFADDLILFTKK